MSVEPVVICYAFGYPLAGEAEGGSTWTAVPGKKGFPQSSVKGCPGAGTQRTVP